MIHLCHGITAEKHYPRTKGYHDRKKNYAEIPQSSLFTLFMPVYSR
ncbi:hypothetical protein PZH37_01515 [[Eubacterium] siraeum]|nr:hypothetical protein [[Eubacterium] siraeum]